MRDYLYLGTQEISHPCIAAHIRKTYDTWAEMHGCDISCVPKYKHSKALQKAEKQVKQRLINQERKIKNKQKEKENKVREKQ